MCYRREETTMTVIGTRININRKGVEMKKILWLSLILVLVLTGCSSNKELEDKILDLENRISDMEKKLESVSGLTNELANTATNDMKTDATPTKEPATTEEIGEGLQQLFDETHYNTDLEIYNTVIEAANLSLTFEDAIKSMKGIEAYIYLSPDGIRCVNVSTECYEHMETCCPGLFAEKTYGEYTIRIVDYKVIREVAPKKPE